MKTRFLTDFGKPDLREDHKIRHKAALRKAEDGYLDYSWHSLVNDCQTILMEDLANGTQQYEVMVRALDIAGTGSRSKALLFRYAVGQGTVMVTGLNVLQNLTNRGETNHTAHTGGCPADFPFPINPNTKNGKTGSYRGSLCTMSRTGLCQRAPRTVFCSKPY